MYKTTEDSPKHTINDSIPSNTTETSTTLFHSKSSQNSNKFDQIQILFTVGLW